MMKSPVNRNVYMMFLQILNVEMYHREQYVRVNIFQHLVVLLCFWVNELDFYPLSKLFHPF